MKFSPRASVTAPCLGFIAAVTACAAPEPGVAGESAAVLADPIVPRGAEWKYWDQGGDPGSSWRFSHYDDDAWPAGAGPLGYGESYIATTVDYGGDPDNKHITTYFRRDVVIDDPEDLSRITGEVMYDDGLVVYFNGTPVYAAGLSTFPSPTPTTLASGHEASNSYQVVDLTGGRSALFDGRNTIAVEVHQASADSSDLVFDFSLAVEVVTLPDDVLVPRGGTWEYNDAYTGEPHNWTQPFSGGFLGTGVAPLGYGESYLATEIRRPTESYQSPTTYYRYYFEVEDPLSITELHGELMWDDGAVVYLNNVQIDSVSMPPGDVTYTTLALGHEAANTYHPRDWTAFRHHLREGDNVIAVELHQHDRQSSDAVFDLSLTMRRSPPVPEPGEDIARGAVWTYWDRGGDLGTAWRAPAYDDSAWRRDAAPLGYGESYVATVIEYGPDAGDKHRTTYFRNRFRVADRDAVTSLAADVMYDDGAVIYLNGTEVTRLAMPSGTITAATLSTGHEAGNTYLRHDLDAFRHLLVDGDNVIAVEVHQASASSSDLVFDLALDVGTSGPPPPPPPGIARGSSWRYFAADTRPGFCCSDWTEDADIFDDEHWPLGPGPLGYGESYVRTTVPFGPDPADKYMTTYFRNSFVIEDPARITALVAEVMYDDGVIVYLNRRRVVTRGLPELNVEHDTRAAWHEANNTYETIDLAGAIQHLKPGRNTIAVEVHQDSPTSSDLVFDLALRFEEAPPLASTTRSSIWLYYDRGPLDPGWQTSSDNRGWDGGRAPLGYNNLDHRRGTPIGFHHTADHRPVTTYFRRRFTVASPSAITEIRGELLVDDGAVVYLNGTEIARFGLPAGELAFDTRAASHESNGRYVWLDLTAHRSLLRDGENVVAVEVHQDAAHPTDADLSFDLGLELITAATPRIAADCAPATPPPLNDFGGVWIAPGGAVWVTGGAGLIGRRDAGGEWAWCRYAEDWTALSAVWGLGDASVWFAGDAGRVLRWNGAGFHWIDSGAGTQLLDVWGSGPNQVFVVAGDGIIRRYDGSEWHAAGDVDGQVNALWGAGPDDAWAVGVHQIPAPGGDDYEDECRATIFRWNPVTQVFELEDYFNIFHGGCGFLGVGGSGPDDVWAVGDRFPAGAATGYAFAAHYDGTGWQSKNPTDDLQEDRVYTDVVSGAPGGTWITAAGDTSVRYDGTTWSAGSVLTEDLLGIDARGGAMFAVGRDNKVLRWDGAGWVRDY